MFVFEYLNIVYCYRKHGANASLYKVTSKQIACCNRKFRLISRCYNARTFTEMYFLHVQLLLHHLSRLKTAKFSSFQIPSRNFDFLYLLLRRELTNSKNVELYNTVMRVLNIGSHFVIKFTKKLFCYRIYNRIIFKNVLRFSEK